MFRDRDKWRVRWREGGKPRTKSFDTKQEAALFEAQMRTGTVPVRSREVERLTFAAWTEKWFEVYAKVRKSETQWVIDRMNLKNHILPAIGELKIHEIKRSHGLDLMAALTAKGLKEKTVNNVFHLAKKILSVAVDYEIIPANPWQLIKNLQVPQPDFRFWTKSESDKFLRRCRELRPEFADYVLVAIHTGLRWGELKALKRMDLDFETGVITVRRTYSKRLKKIMERTKNKEIGRVEMSPEVIQVMKTRMLMKPEQFVFSDSLTNNSWDYLKFMCEKAQVQVIDVHDLRHTCASQLAMAGIPLYKIQRHLRHKDFKTTLRYAHLSPESLSGITAGFSGPQTVRNDLENAHQKLSSLQHAK